MKESPILFSGPMVRAILEDRKTQTRRIVKPQPEVRGNLIRLPKQVGFSLIEKTARHVDATTLKESAELYCPYGAPGDRLWVRECFAYYPGSLPEEREVLYREGHESFPNGWPSYRGPIGDCAVWRPSIHMPRWASRLLLEIVSIRVERLQEITEADAESEQDRSDFLEWAHAVAPSGSKIETAKESFQKLWESINGPGSWEQNPWVWVVEFKRIEQ